MFTFESLGTDVGVTAKKRRTPLNFKNVFWSLEIDVRYIAAIGDFEALSSENLERMNLNKTQFIKN